MTEIQGESILVRVSARFELARVRVIGSQLRTFRTRPRSQFAASSCRTRPTLLVRLTDVVVNRNLTQTASTLNRLRSTVPQPRKLYGLRSYESYTNPVYLHLYPLRGYICHGVTAGQFAVYVIT